VGGVEESFQTNEVELSKHNGEGEEGGCRKSNHSETAKSKNPLRTEARKQRYRKQTWWRREGGEGVGKKSRARRKKTYVKPGIGVQARKIGS